MDHGTDKGDKGEHHHAQAVYHKCDRDIHLTQVYPLKKPAVKNRILGLMHHIPSHHQHKQCTDQRSQDTHSCIEVEAIFGRVCQIDYPQQKC